MSFKFTSGAAKTFIQNFYDYYLRSRRRSGTDAVFFTRSLLRCHQHRARLSGFQVQLPGYLVPARYLARREESHLLYDEFEGISSEVLNIPPLVEDDQAGSPLITGREHDILEIEWRLLWRSDANTLLLYGVPGVGKIVLIRYLCSWWFRPDW